MFMGISVCWLPLSVGAWISNTTTLKRINCMLSFYKTYVAVVIWHIYSTLTVLTHMPVRRLHSIRGMSCLFAESLRARVLPRCEDRLGRLLVE